MDTHTSHPVNHLRLQRATWDKVSSIFDYFKSVPYGSSSLFEHTTFAVVSEFSRTPFLNASKGKDHNPLTNSVLFAGRGIRGGTVLGKSTLIEKARSSSGTAYHMALPIHYDSGASGDNNEGADFIYPENVAMTLAAVMGAKPGWFASVPAKTKPLPIVVPS